MECTRLQASHHYATIKRRIDRMPLTMNREVFITCAVTGAGNTVSGDIDSSSLGLSVVKANERIN